MTTPKNPAAVALGRRGGRAKVSKGLNAAKTPEQRAEWAAKMVEARRAKAIKKESLDAMRHRKATGQCVGNLPFGQRLAADGVHLESDEAEQDILHRIAELKAAGFSTRRIADELNRQGVTTRRGTA